jgi:3-oxoacyl-[acyl-carrier protein] reductase
VTDRIAIVTGSARGIGAATARRLAADGMAVAVLDLDEAAGAGTVKEIADAGGRAVAVGADVAHTISFLVSEGAGFVSGQVIYVAGGPLC